MPPGIRRITANFPDRLIFGQSYRTICDDISFNPARFVPELYSMLLYARDHTEFWGECIPSHFVVDETLSVYDSLPYITTDNVSAELHRFTSSAFNKTNSYLATTGGTGRSPTTVLLSNESYGIEWAHMHDIWSHIGYERKKYLKLTLRGIHLPGNELVRYNPIYNELVVDTFKLSWSNFSDLVSSVSRYSIAYLHGYPSLLFEFKEYCAGHGVHFEGLRGIMLGSEGATVAEKIALSNFFGCHVISWYGQTEKVALAVDVDTNDRFHIYSSYGHLSLKDADETGFGEIVGTTFVNKALPLIKYRTGDYGRLHKGEKSYHLSDIVGRWGKDFVYLDENKRIPTASINIHGPIQKELLFYQIHQSEYGKLVYYVHPKKTASVSDKEIEKCMAAEMGERLKNFSIEVRITHDEADIVRSERGKRIMLVQNIPVNRHDMIGANEADTAKS